MDCKDEHARPRRRQRPIAPAVALLTAAAVASGCGGGGAGGGGNAVSGLPVHVGGTVSGLTGIGLVIADNGSDRLTVTANGPFVFPVALEPGASYDVTVAAQPDTPPQNCAVANGAGTAGTGDVTSVAVTCGPLPSVAAVYPIGATDLEWEATRGALYVTIGASAAAGANSVARVDPATGQIGQLVPAGPDPGVVRVSDDGAYLYVGLHGASSVQRFQLPALAADITIPLGYDALYGPGRGDYVAGDLAVAPGAPRTIAVSRHVPTIYPTANLVIFDDAAARGPTGGGALPDQLAWGADAATIYSVDAETSDFSLGVYRVDAAGAHGTATVREAFPDGFELRYSQGLLYGNDGNVIDPASANVVASFPTPGRICVDAANQRLFVLWQDVGLNLWLVAYELAHLTPVGIAPLPNVRNPVLRLVRFGRDGLAAVTNAGELVIIAHALSLPPPALGGGGGLIAARGGATAYAVYDLPVNDLVWSAQQNLLYVTLPSTAAGRGNSIAAFDPAAGAIRASAFIGSEPGRLSLAADGQTLYLGFYGMTAFARLTLPDLTRSAPVLLGADPGFGPLYAVDVQAAPGSSTTLAVLRSFYGAITPSLAIFDGATPRSQTVLDANDGVQWGGDASVLYGYHTGADVLDVAVFPVTATGVMPSTAGMEALYGSVARSVHFASNLLYGDDGTVFDPASLTIRAAFQGVGGSVMVPDLAAGVGYFASGDLATPGVVLYAVDLAHGTIFGTLQAPDVQGLPYRIVRWGADGIAFATTAGELVVVRGALVTARPPGNPCGPAVSTLLTQPGLQDATFRSTLVSAGAKDLAVEPHAGVLYLSVAAAAAPGTNCIVPLDPASGALGAGAYAGSRPSLLAVSQDGSKLYAALAGAQTIERFALPALTHELSIPVSFSTDPLRQPIAGAIEVAPGAPGTIAVIGNSTQISPSPLGVAIYDDATRRPVAYGERQPLYVASIQWSASAATLYGTDGNFYTFAVDPSGLTLAATVPGVLSHGNAQMHRFGSLIYTDGGQVLDPASGTIAGAYLLPAGAAGGEAMTVDTPLGVAYFAYVEFATNALRLQAFDAGRFTPLRNINLGPVGGSPTRIVRFGTDGLAIVTTTGMVALVQGSFVTG